MKPPNADALTEALSRALPGMPTVRISGVASLGAQRQTFFLELGPDSSEAHDRVERRRAVVQIASQVVRAASVGDEAALVQSASAAGVPVPAVLAVIPELGAIVSEHIDGETIPRKILRKVKADPNLGVRLTSDLGHAFAAIHRVPTNTLRGLDDYSRTSRYIDELTAQVDGLTTPHPVFRLGLRWLSRLAPPPTSDDTAPRCLVHGDLRLGNFIAANDGLVAVLDWELAHLGDPMEDLAWVCLRTWRFGNDEREVGGFGDRARLRSAYQDAGGVWRDDAFAWWTVARTLWWGIGLARQVQVFLEGGSDSIVLAASGRRVVELEYDLLRLIEP